MSDLHWESRHHSRDEFHHSMPDSSPHEVDTRHSRFSRWQISVNAARSSIRDDARPSLDASSSYTIRSHPSTSKDTPMPVTLKLLTPKPNLRTIIAHMRLDSTDSSDGPFSPLGPTLDLNDWPTPPTSAISPTPSTTFPAAQLPWKTPPSSAASGTLKAPWKSQPAHAADRTLLAREGEHGKPNIPERSQARKSPNSALLDEIDQVDELLKSRCDQLRTEMNKLRHKSSFLEETLKQTVHQRLALHAEREAISPSGDPLRSQVLDLRATVIDRGRSVPRSGHTLSNTLWDARDPSALGMVPEIESLPSPTQSGHSSKVRAVQSAVDTRRTMPPPDRRKPVLSIMPNIVSVPKTRLPTAPSPATSLRRSISLPRGTTAGRKMSPTRAMSETKALRYTELTGANAPDSAFHRIIDVWKSIGARVG